MKGIRASIICALAVPGVADFAKAVNTCGDEACEVSPDASYAESMLASMDADALSVNLLQRKASENLKAPGATHDDQMSGKKCKASCLSDKRPWGKKCKKGKCSGCFECGLQSGSYVLDGDGECRGSKTNDDSWHSDTGRYALNFNVNSVDGTSVGYSTFPRPWKGDNEKVFYRSPSSRLQTQSFPVINSYCGQICDSLSFCKGYQLTMRGCEHVKPGKSVESGKNCEYAYNGECYCWSAADCYIVTDYKTYANSEYAASAGLNMGWGASKTFSTAMGDMTAQTYCSGGGGCDQEVKIGGKKTKNYPRTGYFCFMKNKNAAGLLQEDDEDDDANEFESDAASDDLLIWPSSAKVTKMCANGTLLPAKSELEEPFC